MYSALPYTFAQVSLTDPFTENKWKIINNNLIYGIYMHGFAGGNRMYIYCYPITDLHSYPLLNDWVPLESW
jgi:hypothetical protein